MPSPWDYFRLMREGKTDREIAEEFGVTIGAVRRYRGKTPIYSLDFLEELVLGMREKRNSRISTMYRAARARPESEPFDNLFIIEQICRILRKHNLYFSRGQVYTALKYAYDPEVHIPTEKKELMKAVFGDPQKVYPLDNHFRA